MQVRKFRNPGVANQPQLIALFDSLTCFYSQAVFLHMAIYLPIRSIDFYYPEFRAATVRISRDKPKMCFLKPTWSNLCRNFLNLLYNAIYSAPVKSNNFQRGCSMSVEGSNAAILVHKLT